MLKLLKIELSRAFKSRTFFISLAIGCFLSIAFVFVSDLSAKDFFNFIKGQAYPRTVFSEWMGNDSLELPAAIFYFILPILAVIPFAESYFSDKKSGYVKNIFTRTNKTNYFISKYIATFLTAGVVVIIPQILNFLLMSMFFPMLQPEILSGIFVTTNGMFRELFFNNPYLYILLYLLIDFIFCGILACLSLAFANFIDNKFTVILLPFLICIAMYFISNWIDRPQFSPLLFMKMSQPVIWLKFSIILVEGLIFAIFGIVGFFGKGLRDDTF